MNARALFPASVRLLLGLIFSSDSAFSASSPSARDLAANYRLFRVDRVALSPDGRYLASVERVGENSFVVITEVDRPESKATLKVGEDTAQADDHGRSTTNRAFVSFLQWATSTRLVYQVHQATRGADTSGDLIWAVDADGQHGLRIMDDNKLIISDTDEEENPLKTRTPRALGFRFSDPTLLAVEAIDGGKNAPSDLFKVDVQTGKYALVSAQHTDGTYLYDQQGRPRVHETIAFYTTPGLAVPVPGGLQDSGPGPAMAIESNLPVLPIVHWQKQRFRYREPDGTAWTDFDVMLGATPSYQFHTSVEEHFSQRSFPLAFDVDPNVLYFASNVGRQTYGIYALDLRTKKRTDFAIEDPFFDLVDPGDVFADNVLVFDRQRRCVGVRLPGQQKRTRWFDAALAERQVTLEKKFPGRGVEILDWADDRRRIVALVSSASDPGRYYVYDEGKPGSLTEFRRRAPWLSADKLSVPKPFAFDTPAGVHLTGVLVLPRQPAINPPALVLVCHDVLERFSQTEFQRDLQALAELGFAVASVDFRGSGGLGAAHRDAIKSSIDDVPAEDIHETVRWIAAHQPINAKRVALYGEGFGGYLALRTLQRYPDDFRGAVAINAPATPRAWVQPSYEELSLPIFATRVRRTFFDSATLARANGPALGDSIIHPVLFVQDEFKRDLASETGKTLRDRLRLRQIESEYLKVEGDFTAGDPDARGKAFAKIAEFLNRAMYEYGVIVGPAKEVK